MLLPLSAPSVSADAEGDLCDKVRLAAKMDDMDMLRQLLKDGASPDCASSDGKSALMSAAWAGAADAVDFLLEQGAKSNLQDNDGITALMLAGGNQQTDYNKKTDIAKMLLETANPNSVAKDGRTALHFAAFHGHEGVVRALLENGAEVDPWTDDNWTPLMIAASAGKSEATRTLLEYDADIDLGGEEFSARAQIKKRVDREKEHNAKVEVNKKKMQEAGEL
jgi:ankyrin